MLSIIKASIPTPIKKVLILIKQKTYIPWQKKRLFENMQVKHAELLNEIKGKEKVKVLFLAIHESVWKVDPVFKRMLEDPFFQPEILVCPYTTYGEEQMLKDMEQAYNYFSNKGYPVRKSKNKDGSWIKISDINPDIVFFTNPHNLTRKEYYEDAYLKYLSCYCGYGMPISKYAKYEGQYNQSFHNAIWSVFIQTKEMLKHYKRYSARDDYNIHLVGDNIIEQLEISSKRNGYAWRDQKNKIKVIYAPHHTIEDNEALSLGTFLRYGLSIKELAIQNKDKIYWSFKPHPLLKPKLYLHEKWGKEKTDDYYLFWESSDFSQLDEGEYIDLFSESDALILDSSSFLGEYLFTKKPILYLMKDNIWEYMSDFGTLCLDASYQAFSADDISNFIIQTIENNDPLLNDRLKVIDFYENDIDSEKNTSQIIVDTIKYKIRNS